LCGGAYLVTCGQGLAGEPCWGVVQLVGHHTVNVDGEGSNPSAPANFPLQNGWSWRARITRMRKYFLLILLVPFQMAVAQQPSRPEVPEKLAAPASENLVLQAHATGSQVYVCQMGTDQKLAWILKAPEAELLDSSGAVIGKHYAGPTWKHADGSEVVGKVIAKQDAPDAKAIPWLLLAAASHAGDGVLAGVTSIQRIHTKGGQPPPSGCDDAHRGAETKAAYSADYYFYAPAH
jgi:hypothetical protein